MENSFEEYLNKYRDELVILLHKSQDQFEKQLSYISAGSLTLSVGFIKDVVKNIGSAKYKWLLQFGWILLALTLLVNCISHIISASKHNKTIDEINNELNGNDTYDHNQIKIRYKQIEFLNWATIGLMIVGILLIILFVSSNL